MSTTLIIIALPLVLIFALSLVRPELSVWLKARRDYLNSRGTSHLRLLRARHAVLNKEIASNERSLASTLAHSERLKSNRQHDLQLAASSLLVKNGLTTIPGIGETLKQRIIHQCFTGELKSLNNVTNVHGVGPQKASAIHAWVQQATYRLPTIIQQGFPGKEDIMRSYDKLDREVEAQLSSTRNELQTRKQLLAQLDEAIGKLSPVTISTFRDALKGNTEAGERVSQYLTGTYPEWGAEPTWLKEAMRASGTEQKAP